MLTESFLEDITNKVKEHLEESFEEVINGAERLGLDPRAGYHLYVGDQYIVVEKGHNARYLSYYGGFEYVDSAYVHEAGGYIFYSALDPRVADALDLFHDRPPSNEEE